LPAITSCNPLRVTQKVADAVPVAGEEVDPLVDRQPAGEADGEAEGVEGVGRGSHRLERLTPP
jgi:hypothetical protein